MKKFLAVCCLIFVLGLGAGWAMTRSLPDLPPLNDGDLIFHTSTSNQSLAILVSTASAYTHMGIIRLTASGPVVIEAAGQVRETPLSQWVARGVLRRVAIYRDPDLTPAEIGAVLAGAKALYSRPYDIHFSFDNDAIYCSELPYLAFRKAGLSLGRVQTVGDLHTDNFLVTALIRKRWQSYTPCTAKGLDFDQCRTAILAQPLVTPISIARDARLRQVYSNYPW